MQVAIKMPYIVPTWTNLVICIADSQHFESLEFIQKEPKVLTFWIQCLAYLMLQTRPFQ